MARLLSGSGTIGGGASQAELDAFVGTTNIATVGTVGTGTWEGTDVGVAHGGTGASTLTANSVLLGNGTSAPQMIAPSTDGNVLTSTGSTWQSEAVPGGGITHASRWMVPSSNFAGDVVGVNFSETAGPTGFGVLGTSMTFGGVSTGIFVFPVTGFWYIRYQIGGYSENGVGWVSTAIETTHNDSTYAAAGSGTVYDYAASGDRMTVAEDYIFKVESTSNYKVRFTVSNEDDANLILHTVTGVTFSRLGDL